MMTKPTIALIAGLFTLLAQFEVIFHELEHLHIDEKGEICELCIIAANTSNQLTADVELGIAEPTTSFLPHPLSYRFVFIQNHPAKPARGPPLTSQSQFSY